MKHVIEIPELDDLVHEAERTGCRDGMMWSHRDLAILEKYYRQPGVTLRVLAKVLNRSYASVQSKITRIGLCEEGER